MTFDLKRFPTKPRALPDTVTLDTDVPAKKREGTIIGCPLEWARRVRSIVRTKDQMLVAIWLHRRLSICHKTTKNCPSKLFSVPNAKLRIELGVSREVKYSTLRRLEAAGAIAIIRNGKHALQIQILW
jgi:hypothetical protein